MRSSAFTLKEQLIVLLKTLTMLKNASPLRDFYNPQAETVKE